MASMASWACSRSGGSPSAGERCRTASSHKPIAWLATMSATGVLGELLPQLTQLLGVPARRTRHRHRRPEDRGLVGLGVLVGRLMLAARRPESAHAGILTSSHPNWEVGPACTRRLSPPGRRPSGWCRARVRCHGRPSGRPMADSRCPPSSRLGAVADAPSASRPRGDHIATDDARINDRIRAREVLLIGPQGEQLGVKPLPEALAIARERGARSGRGRAQRQSAGVPDHGLQQVQVRAAAAAEGITKEGDERRRSRR